MNINEIAYFLDVAETQHMTKSAQRLHVAQPAISRSIAHLEAELGAKLFVREGRGIKLTPEGHLLQRKLIPVDAQLRDIERVFANLREGKRDEVRIQLSAGSHIVSDALGSWMSENPSTHIRLTQMVVDGKAPGPSADIMVSADEPSGEYALRRSYSERVMLVAPAAMDLPDPVDFSDLASLEFISLPSKTGFSRFVADMCMQEGFAPSVALESDNPSVVRKMIGMGLGVGFWPEKSWGSAGEGLCMHMLANGASRTLYVALAESSRNSAAAEECYRYLCTRFDNVFR